MELYFSYGFVLHKSIKKIINMPRKFWIGLTVLFLLYSAYYIFFFESPLTELIPRKIRHLIKFTMLITFYLIGLRQLNLEKIAWMQTIWHIVHISGIFIIISFGAFDWIVHPLPLNIRSILFDINEFLIAPTLYVSMGLLHKFLLEEKKEE